MWSFSASAYTYVVPDSQNYVQPTVAADHGWLHLETRYNYEGLHAGSAWLGYNFNGGKKLTWELTPMLGGVFGDTEGISPGAKGSLGWWKLELYGEGEYLIDPGDSSNSFAYLWSEFTLAPAAWFRFGAVTQRTRVYKSDRSIQRGCTRARLNEACEFHRVLLQSGRGQALVPVRRRSALLVAREFGEHHGRAKTRQETEHG